MEFNNNWDLFAVVRGFLPSSTDDFSWFPSSPVVKNEVVSGNLFRFPDIEPILRDNYGLEELCNGINVKNEEINLQAQQYVINYNTSMSMFPAINASPQQFEQELKQQHKPISNTPRSKKRKSQQKKVVCQVPADGVTSDVWAWRKYGQKPIKGSPYPRGYYRCSSSKGCQARKQVERSRANPTMLLITYTAEHNHPVPTHRNSLAGSTRQKFPNPNPNPNRDQLSVSAMEPLDDDNLNPKSSVGEEEDDEYDEEEELLSFGDVEMIGENDMMFLGMEVMGIQSKTPTEVNSGYMENVSDFEEHFLRPPWLAGNDLA